MDDSNAGGSVYDLRIELQQAPGASLGAGAGPVLLRAGHPVVLLVTLRNLDAVAATVGRWSAWFEYEYALAGPAGEVPRTRFGHQQFREPIAGTSEVVTLAPQAALVSTVLLSRIFDLTLAGRYTLRLSRELRGGATGEWVALASNELGFRVDD